METAEQPVHKEFILTIEALNKAFDGFQVITDLNFYLDKGELRAIIGPNGAGKSTLLDMITGRTRPDSGTIEFGAGHDHDLTRMREYEINRLGIARKFQSPTIYREHTVYENLSLSLPRVRGVFQSLFYKESQAERDRIFEVLRTINLEDRAQDIAGSLSHGQKQWLEIGMLLVQEPKLLLVDEPAAGMTDEETEKTGHLLHSLEGSHSIVVIEHDMEFIRQLERKVTVLHQGTVLCEGPMDKVQNDRKVIEVYLGRKHAAEKEAL